MFKVFASGEVARNVVELLSSIYKLNKLKEISEDSEENSSEELKKIKNQYVVISNKKSKLDYIKTIFKQENRDFEVLNLNSIHNNDDEEKVEKALQGLNMVFILGNMRDKQSLDNMELISEIAKRKSILSIAMALIPHFTDKAEQISCYKEVESLARKFDTFIPILAEKMAYGGKMAYVDEEGVEHGESCMLYFIEPLLDAVATDGPVTLEIKDLEDILKNQGLAFMAVGEDSGENKIDIVSKIMLKAYEGYNIVSLREAKKILINIEAGYDIDLLSINEIAEKIQSYVREDADIVFTAIKNDKLEDYLKVAVVGTDFK